MMDREPCLCCHIQFDRQHMRNIGGPRDIITELCIACATLTREQRQAFAATDALTIRKRLNDALLRVEALERQQADLQKAWRTLAGLGG